MDTTAYIYKFCGFELDPLKKVLRFKEVPFDISEKSFQFIEKLLIAENAVVDKYCLLDELWKNLVVSEASLSRLVSDTRHVLNEHVSDREIIQTLRGRGFRIHPDIVIEKMAQSDSVNERKIPDPLLIKKSNTKQKKPLVFMLSTVCFLLSIFVWFGFYQSYDDIILRSNSSALLTVLPVNVLTEDDQDRWVEYGVMTMAVDELQRFPQIKVASISSTLGTLGNIQFQYDSQTLFDQVCIALGCKQLLVMSLTLSEKKEPRLSYQLLTAKQNTPTFSFLNEDILEASNMMLEHILQTLIPQSPERLMLSHTYTNNAVVNQDYAIGVSRLYHGDFNSAKDYLNLALKREPTFMWAKIYQIEVLYREGELEQAKKNIDVLLRQALDIRQNIFLQNLLSNIAYSQGNLEQSIEITKKLLPTVEQTEDKELLGAAHMNMGTSYQATGNIEEAMEHLYLALDTFQKHDFKLREAQALLNIGNTIWLGQNNYELSNQYYQQAADIFRQLGARNYLAYAKNMAAGTKISTKRYKIAKRELKETAKLYQEFGDTEGVLIVEADLVLIALKEQDFAQALDMGLAVYQKSGEQFTYPKSIVSAYLALIYLNLNQVENAKIYIEQRNQYDWFDPRPEFAMIPASYAHSIGDYQQAVKLCEKLKVRLGENWNSGHENYFNAFKQDLAQGNSSIKDYANLKL